MQNLYTVSIHHMDQKDLYIKMQKICQSRGEGIKMPKFNQLLCYLLFDLLQDLA